MDLFAIILITITAVTICGICLFIFICALQPKFLRKLHGKTNRTYQGTDSNASYNENGDYHSVKSLNLALESNKSPTCSSSRSNIRDKNAYLKSLERSLRTGRRIQDEEDNDNDNHSNNQSRLNLFNFICNFINKHIRRRATHPNESMEL